MKTQTFKFNRRKLAHAVALAVLAIAANQAHATDYIFSDLGTLTGPDPVSIPQRINNNGQVVGVIFNDGDESYTPVVWNGTTKTILDSVPGGVGGIATSINEAGHMAGWIDMGAAADAWTPARWNSDGSVVPLDTIGGGSSTYSASAEAINNHDQTAGYMWVTNSVHAMRWDGTAVTDLGTLGGATSYAYGINDAGQIIGSSFTTDDAASHATLWHGTDIIDLGTLGGINSEAYDINEAGQSVGWSNLPGDEIVHAALWNGDGSAPVDLGGLAGATYEFANGINSKGQIVGGSFFADDSMKATLWENGQAIDLSSYLPAELAAAGWIFGPIEDINDQGVIVGYATNTLDNHYIGIMLTPVAVPVPGAIWLFGSALVGLIGAGRRRQTLWIKLTEDNITSK